MEKRISTKTQLLEFTQDYGTAKMQLFVSSHQRKLKEFLDDAFEWGRAREAAQAERESSWELLCRFADTPCKGGHRCNYLTAANRIFAGDSIFDGPGLSLSSPAQPP